MSVSSFFPIVTTADLPRLLSFYADGLGAVEHYRFPPGADPDYVGLHLAGQPLGIGRAPSVPTGAPRTAVWCYVDDCDQVVARLAALGATVVEPPVDQPWGERVGRVLDPDGNELIIGSSQENP